MNNLQISEEYKPVLEHVKSFIQEKIEPMEEEFHRENFDTLKESL